MKNCCNHKQNNDKEIIKNKSGQYVYTCPMHPDVIRDEPGLCPGCGMALIPSVATSMEGKPKEVGGSYAVSEMSHKDHDVAMTSPQMATKREQDMRRRFLVSLLLSIPIFLYS